MPYDTSTPETIAEQGRRALDRARVAFEEAARAQRLAILKPAPLAPRPPIDFAAVKAEADALYASGYGRSQSYAGLADSIALAGRKAVR